MDSSMDNQLAARTAATTQAGTAPTCADALRSLAVLLARAEVRRLAAAPAANVGGSPKKETQE
jgi:hypothetical protein